MYHSYVQQPTASAVITNPPHTTSAMPTCCVGIDVAKDTLAVALLKGDVYVKEFAAKNSAAGHRQIAKRLAAHGNVLVALEATSNYNLELCLYLHSCDDISVALINPKQAHDFKAAAMSRAKTDPIDAQGLALLAQRMRPRLWQPPCAAAMKLRAMGRRIAELIEMRTQELNRQHAASCTTVLETVMGSTNRMIECIDEEVAAIEKQALELIQGDADLHRMFVVLCSIKGVALRSGIELLGEIACLPPGMDKRQWVSFFGLDPVARESGTSLHGQRRISRRGSPHMRRILFMVALVACQHEPSVAAWYNKLTSRGKPKRLAQCAVMRKLLCAFWGMLANDEPFDGAKFNPTP